MLNMMTLTPEAKIGLLPIGPEGEKWMALFTHMLEELGIRDPEKGHERILRGMFTENPLPDFAGQLADKAAAIFEKRGITSNQVFIKFGKREHMSALYERGALRIHPAKYYFSKDHNGAVRDDERTIMLSLCVSPEEVKKIVRNPEEVPLYIPYQRVDATVKSKNDFWLYCVTNSVSSRMFVDFNADACVIIRDRDKFRQRMKKISVSNSAGGRDGNCEYIDNLMPRTIHLDIPFAKSYSYTYQNEYRFVWDAKDGFEASNYIDAEIGSLSDIADLIIL